MDFTVTEQMVAVPVSQMRHEIVEVIQLVLVERIKGRVADQMVDIPMPPVMEEIVATRARKNSRARASASDSGKDRRGCEVGPTRLWKVLRQRRVFDSDT